MKLGSETHAIANQVQPSQSISRLAQTFNFTHADSMVNQLGNLTYSNKLWIAFGESQRKSTGAITANALDLRANLDKK
jgi:hypothetical protein